MRAARVDERGPAGGIWPDVDVERRLRRLDGKRLEPARTSDGEPVGAVLEDAQDLDAGVVADRPGAAQLGHDRIGLHGLGRSDRDETQQDERYDEERAHGPPTRQARPRLPQTSQVVRAARGLYPNIVLRR